MSELTTLFKNTADAIRSKTGDTATMQASQFPAKIRGISVGISQDEADARYLRLSGGTMTGNLILNGAPTADNQAATKKYVDDNAGGKLTLIKSVSITASGDTNKNTPVSIPNLNLSKPLYYNFTLSDGYTIGYASSKTITSIGLTDSTSGGISYPAFKLSNSAPVTYNGFTSGMCILTPCFIRYDGQGSPGIIRYGFYCYDRSSFTSVNFANVVTCGFGNSDREYVQHTGTITFNFYQ